MAEVSYFWELIFRDGEAVEVKPEHVKELKRQLKEQKHLITKDWTRNVSDVKSFNKTSRPTIRQLSEPGLEEDAARAFGEPILQTSVENGIEYTSVVCKWVKRSITKHEWNKTYRHRAGHFMLDSDYVAFMQPVHTLDPNTMTELSKEELHKIGIDK